MPVSARRRPERDCSPNGAGGLARRRVSPERLGFDDRDSQRRESDAQGCEDEDVVDGGAGGMVPGDPLVAFSPYAKGLTTGEISAHFAELDPGQYLQGHALPDH